MAAVSLGFLFRKEIRSFQARDILAGALLALTGLWLLTGKEAGEPAGGFGRGEALTLLCALCFAAHIVGVDIYARRHNVRRIAFWQVAAAGLLSVPFALLAETPRITPTFALAGAVVVTGLGCTALAIAVQNAVQAKTTPTDRRGNPRSPRPRHLRDGKPPPSIGCALGFRLRRPPGRGASS